jgi:hypothetical protein
MTDMTTDSNIIQPDTKREDITVLMGITISLSFGATMLIFSLLYVKDLQTLAQLPEMVWLFICGKPGENGVILPALVLMTTIAFIVAATLWGWERIRRARNAT